MEDPICKEWQKRIEAYIEDREESSLDIEDMYMGEKDEDEGIFP